MGNGKLFILCTFALSTLAACGGGGSSAAKDVFNVGICQLVNHEALDAATKGFQDELTRLLGEGHVKFDLQNAAGEPANCTTIANTFTSKKVDLIMANATPALQAAANATLTIPILGTSITEYGVALEIKDFSGKTGMNISGTSDLAPLVEQVDMIEEIVPDAQKVGLLYCASEANSKYQIDVVKAELAKRGKTTSEITFSDSNELSQVLNAGINGLDALYIPTDNTCAKNGELIRSILEDEDLPVIAGEEDLCRSCGAVTLSISYYNIGVKTGKMAYDILKNGADIKTMEIGYDENPVKKYNKAICDDLGITPPAGYEMIADTDA